MVSIGCGGQERTTIQEKARLSLLLSPMRSLSPHDHPLVGLVLMIHPRIFLMMVVLPRNHALVCLALMIHPRTFLVVVVLERVWTQSVCRVVLGIAGGMRC